MGVCDVLVFFLYYSIRVWMEISNKVLEDIKLFTSKKNDILK